MYFQNWSAFAPDFTELEENEEYIEREDEFDAVRHSAHVSTSYLLMLMKADEEELRQAKKRRAEDQNALVDIITVEKHGSLSEDEDDMFFLPTKPIPDRELDSNAAPSSAPAGSQDVSAGITVVEDPAEKQS